MAITIEAVDQVIERTGVSYKEAREALLASNGDVVDALVYLEEKLAEEARAAVEAAQAEEAAEAENRTGAAEAAKKKAAAVVDYIRGKINAGNVSKIRLSREGRNLLTVPVNVGLVGGLAGIAAAPMAVLAAAIIAYGFDVKVEIIRDDGTSEQFSADSDVDTPDFDAVVEAAEKEAAPIDLEE